MKPDSTPCDFIWTDDKQLLVGWGDFVQICAIKMRQGTPKVEIQQMFKTEFLIAGLCRINKELLILAFEPHEKPSMRIITSEVTQYAEKCCDIVTMRGYSNFTGEHYKLCALKNDEDVEECFFVVSPKDVIGMFERKYFIGYKLSFWNYFFVTKT